MATDKPVRILTIAGSDSGGGAGIQGDIKTISALGGYAMSAITSVTAQDTRGIGSVVDLDPAFVAEQIRLPLEDIGIDGIKVGMLRSAAVIDAVAEALDGAEEAPLVLDPIVAASDGTTFLSSEAFDRFKTLLLPLSDVVTPNVPEAMALSGFEVSDVEGMKRAADKLLELGAETVLVTGGHLEGAQVFDVLATQETLEVMMSPRLKSTSTHGTGCALSSALVTLLAQGFSISEAVTQAREYVHEAIANAPGFGKGQGPLNHNFMFLIEDPN
ncbi:MAG: bifunctional hydroxymethylpyrimidine kinase/phosphomethylpyrimidine kinase [Alphaproteobacteria bacterium]|nr:MAG: bifunctional hydroxymethylpyrimidine kinase/phosphomethylpyrimidine kinase [Alphaproteobacteria bacterium]